jgi:GT2 family glycosyltransferase
VVCIFNSDAVFERLRHHPRIDKFAYNKTNAGVSRSWNIGINLSESDTVFVLNADLHIEPTAVTQLEHYLYHLPKAVLVAPQGAYVDFTQMRVIRYFQKGSFSAPVRTHDVSGFFFAIHMQRFIEHKLSFDVRYSPCFMEEWDMGIQVMRAGLSCYTVPVTAFDHEWGISAGRDDVPIQYFGRTVSRNVLLRSNREKFQWKWFGDGKRKAS